MAEDKNTQSQPEKPGSGYDFLNRITVGLAGAVSGALYMAGINLDTERFAIEAIPGNTFHWAALAAGAAALSLAASGSASRR